VSVSKSQKAVANERSDQSPARPEPLLVPVAEAARLLSLDRATIRILARKGLLAYKKISQTKWLVTTKSIREFANVRAA
jgi:hypothetical protein